jgi:transcriptional regulator with XRE-family HTH domain
VAERTNRPFAEEVPRLLREHGKSIRGLAKEVNVANSFLSRALRGAQYKSPSGALAERVAVAFGKERDFFPEAREDFVIGEIRNDAELRDELYDRLQSGDRRGKARRGGRTPRRG